MNRNNLLHHIHEKLSKWQHNKKLNWKSFLTLALEGIRNDGGNIDFIGQ